MKKHNIFVAEWENTSFLTSKEKLEQKLDDLVKDGHKIISVLPVPSMNEIDIIIVASKEE